jgi:hypothetical protein
MKIKDVDTKWTNWTQFHPNLWRESTETSEKMGWNLFHCLKSGIISERRRRRKQKQKTQEFKEWRKRKTRRDREKKEEMRIDHIGLGVTNSIMSVIKDQHKQPKTTKYSHLARMTSRRNSVFFTPNPMSKTDQRRQEKKQQQMEISEEEIMIQEEIAALKQNVIERERLLARIRFERAYEEVSYEEWEYYLMKLAGTAQEEKKAKAKKRGRKIERFRS